MWSARLVRGELQEVAYPARWKDDVEMECEAFPWSSRRRQHQTELPDVSIVNKDGDTGVWLLLQLRQVPVETGE